MLSRTPDDSMIPERAKVEDRRLGGWVRATFLGWLLGFVGLLVGIAVAEMIVPWESQFAVGVGMGWGVAFVQGRWLAKRVESAKGWVWAGLLGLGLPFIVFDIVDAVGGQLPHRLLWDVTSGALLTGYLQWRVLRRNTKRAGWWVPACVVGWGGALLAVDLPHLLGYTDSALVNLAAILSGGVVLGLVSGGVLVWLLKGSSVDDHP